MKQNSANYTNRTLLFLLMATLLPIGWAPAAQIQGVTVVGSSTQLANLATSTPERCAATNVVSSSGLYGDIHTFIRGGAMWLTSSNIVNNSGATPYITFDLGAVHTLDAMRVWNYNGHASSSPTSAAATNLGVKLANVSYSVDNVTFTTNLANQTFNIAPGTFTNFAQSIPMGGISARYVRIDILTNWATANAQVGLSKVRFVDNTVSPTILSATENYSSNQVTVTFSEPVDPTSATNKANYSVQSGTKSANILSAAMGQFNDRVVLQTSPLTNQNYTLVASGVYDQAQVIAIANNSTVPVQSEVVLWLDANSGVQTDGSGNVTSWTDRSGYGHNALPTTVNQYSAPPTLSTGTLNGLPVVSFNGSQLLAVAHDANLAINGDMTLTLVLERATTGTQDPISKTGGQSTAYTGTPAHGYTNNLPAPFDLQLANSTGKPVWVWGNQDGGAPTTLSSSGGLSAGQYYIVTMVVKGTNVSSYLNGSFNGTAGLPYAVVDAGNPLMLGVRADSGNVSDAGAQFNGNIAEAMVIRGTLAPNDFTAINQYLGTKYNIPIISLAITEQPQNATAQVGGKATFWVGSTGVPPVTYQWKTNNVNIAGATSAVYTTPALTSAYNGLSYSVTVTSPVGSTNSTAATLTVIADTTAPTVFSATKTANATSVVVSYSEAVDSATALNPANYVLNNGASVASASYGSTGSNSVVLTTSTLDPNTAYMLTVRNVQDSFGNTITSATVPVLPANLSLFLRGDSGVTLDMNGLVDKWADQTTNGNHAVQYLAGSVFRPTVGDNINGVAALNFNAGNSNYLQAASSPTLANAGDITIYAVANVFDYNAPRAILGKTLGSQPASFDYYVQSATEMRFYRGNGSVNGLVRSASTPSTGVPHVVSVTMSGTNVSHYLDGKLTAAGGLSTTIADAGAPLKIGSRDDLFQFMNGDMAEVMMFNAALSPSDKTSVDNYLGVKYFPFVITQQPADVITTEGQTATFSVVASQGSAQFVYQWQKNSSNIPGATNASYTTPYLAPSDNGATFDVVIIVPGFSTNVSSTATLTVNNVAPTIVSAGQPIWSQTNVVVVFSEPMDPATAANVANYSLDNGASISAAVIGDVPNKVVLTTSPLNPGTGYTLSVHNVNDPYGNTLASTSVPVGIYPASLALWVKADAGVTADGDGFVTEWDDQSGNANNLTQPYGQPYQPQLVTNPMNGQPALRFAATNETFMGANTSPTLQITGDMSVFAVVNFATLAGNTNGLIVSKASGNLPAPFDYYARSTQVQLYRGDGTAYGLASSARVPSVGKPHLVGFTMQGTAVTHWLDGSANGSSTLSTSIGDAGTPLYIGARDDGLERLTGDLSELIVLGSSLSTNDLASLQNYLINKHLLPVGSQSYPVITRQPIAATNVNQGGVLTVSIAATGNPAVSYQWYDTNGIAQDGQTSATLNLSNVQTSDSYYAIVANMFGSVTSSVVTVTVNTGAPQVSLTPANIAVYSGIAYTYAVSVTGTAPFAYQWYQDGTAVPNATNSSYSVTTLSGAHTYSCTVSNSFATVSSSTVTLTGVVPAPNNAYPQTVLGDHPIAYWRLDEADDGHSDGNAGVLAHDYVGGHNAVYANANLGLSGYDPTQDSDTAAQFGVFATSNSYAGELDQSTNSLGKIDFAAPAGADAAFSIEAWVNGTNATQTSGAGIVTKGRGNGGEQFDLDVANNAFRFFVRDAAGAVHGPTSTVTLTPGQWYHVVGIWDGPNGAAHLYVNGADVADTTNVAPGVGLLTATTTNAALPAAALVSIGARASNQSVTNFNLQFAGSIDDVAIYNYALSSNSIAAHYQAGSVLPPQSVAISKVGAGQLQLTWSVGTLQSASTVTGPYSNVPNATSPYVVPASNAAQFFRLQVK